LLTEDENTPQAQPTATDSTTNFGTTVLTVPRQIDSSAAKQKSGTP
jgi:hypothetical protein